MDLETINTRWVDIGHPHASPDGGGYRANCPQCPEFKGEHHDSLMAAMNDALGHKVRHPQVES